MFPLNRLLKDTDISWDSCTPGPFWRHCLLHASSSLSPRTLQPWDPNQSGSRDVTPVCPEGNRIRISFSYFYFILSFELECPVNYNLVGVFIFPFLSTANCFTSTGVYMISCGFFLYRFLQNVEYISLCYTVGPGQLFYQHFLFTHSVVSNSL